MSGVGNTRLKAVSPNDMILVAMSSVDVPFVDDVNEIDVELVKLSRDDVTLLQKGIEEAGEEREEREEREVHGGEGVLEGLVRGTVVIMLVLSHAEWLD